MVPNCVADDDQAANMPGETVHHDTPHPAMITACAIGATVLQLLDQTIGNVALPYMQGSFSGGSPCVVVPRPCGRTVSPPQRHAWPIAESRWSGRNCRRLDTDISS